MSSGCRKNPPLSGFVFFFLLLNINNLFLFSSPIQPSLLSVNPQLKKPPEKKSALLFLLFSE